MIDKKNEIKQAAITAVLSAAALTGSLYIGKALDYDNIFIPGTIINGIDVSERTVKETEELLGEYALTVSFRDGKDLTVDGSEIDYHYVSDGSLDRLMEGQNRYLWLYGMYRNTEYTIEEKKEYSKDKLLNILAAFPQMQKANMTEPHDAYLDYRNEQFEVVPEDEGTAFDPDQVTEMILEAVNTEKETLDLEHTENVYRAPEVRKDDEQLNRNCEQLNELAGARIEYELPGGGTKVLDGSVMWDWLEMDDEGDYYRDDDEWDACVTDYVRELADEVDTVYKEHPFTTHEGDEIMLPGIGYYGYRIDKKEEESLLWDELDENEKVTREPVYWRTEASDPDDNHGFGGNYVEVDLSLQHLWVYEDGEVIFETDVVSGLNDAKHRTPAGAFFAYDKKRDTTLRGDKQEDGEWGYETDVAYWIRLTDTGIGLHDASWRYSFGGDIWRWNGSHGCINIPTWAMPTIYDIVETDRPVAVHYGDTQ